MFNHDYKNIKHLMHIFIYLTIANTIFLQAMEQNKKHLPIILVSGICADVNGMDPLIALIKKHVSPNVYVKHPIIGLGKISSFTNVKEQAKELAQDIFNDPELRNGFNLVAHSQGGLLARYYIQRYNKPPVHNYIALGSPQRGVNGIPGDIDTVYPSLHLLEEEVSLLLYTVGFQKWLSFAGYWNDSLHHEKYLAECSFLPYLNNEKNHKYFNLFKENLCKLNNMVLIKSSQEYIVEPAESCHFSFYKNGSDTEIEPLFESDIYKNDTLGLKKLHKSNRLHFRHADCLHTDYESDESNFIANVLPFLIEENAAKTLNKKEKKESTSKCILQ